MKWLKNQWDNNTNFRHAVSVLLVVALGAAGVPPALGSAVGAVLGAVTIGG